MIKSTSLSNTFMHWFEQESIQFFTIFVTSKEYIFYRDGSNVIKTVYMSYCFTLNCWSINKYFDFVDDYSINILVKFPF